MLSKKVNLLVEKDTQHFIHNVLKSKLVEISKEDMLRQKFITNISPYLFRLQDEKLDILFSAFHRPVSNGLYETLINELIQRVDKTRDKVGGVLSFVVNKTLPTSEKPFSAKAFFIKSKLVAISNHTELRKKFTKNIAPYLFYLQEEKLDVLFSAFSKSDSVQESIINELVQRVEEESELFRVLNVVIIVTMG